MPFVDYYKNLPVTSIMQTEEPMKDAETLHLLEELKNASLEFNMEQRALLEESVAAGGPGSIQEAILQAFKICNLTVRKAAHRANISRRVLQDMIDGKREFTIEIATKLYEVFAEEKPDDFNQ